MSEKPPKAPRAGASIEEHRRHAELVARHPAYDKPRQEPPPSDLIPGEELRRYPPGPDDEVSGG